MKKIEYVKNNKEIICYFYDNSNIKEKKLFVEDKKKFIKKNILIWFWDYKTESWYVLYLSVLKKLREESNTKINEKLI